MFTSTKEVAKRLGLSDASFALYRFRKVVATPTRKIGSNLLWTSREIAAAEAALRLRRAAVADRRAARQRPVAV